MSSAIDDRVNRQNFAERRVIPVHFGPSYPRNAYLATRKWGSFSGQEADQERKDLDTAEEDNEEEEVDKVSDDHGWDVVRELLDERPQDVHEGGTSELISTERPSRYEVAPSRPPRKRHGEDVGTSFQFLPVRIHVWV